MFHDFQILKKKKLATIWLLVIVPGMDIILHAIHSVLLAICQAVGFIRKACVGQSKQNLSVALICRLYTNTLVQVTFSFNDTKQKEEEVENFFQGLFYISYYIILRNI